MAAASAPRSRSRSRRGRQGATAARPLPEAYFGTMTFGWSQASAVVNDSVALTMTRKFLASGVQVDTARIYSAGDTEHILGRVLKDAEVAARPRVLATKAHPSQPDGLSAQGLRSQLETSLKALQVDSVDVFYLHQPDPENDLTESLACIQELVKEGKISKYGMSNYSAAEMDRCCQICVEKNYQLPSFYQGLYNPLNRLVEGELLPILRRHNIGFIAYNPLAAGLLTGKHRPGTEVQAGRFKDNPNYLPRFYTDANFQALERIRGACDAAGLGMVPATYAWLLQHSVLDASKGDGVLLGASSVQQLDQNLESCIHPAELPAPVVEAFNAAWSVTKEGAFPFWRSYSKDQPNRENLHPGASYNAAKK